MESNLADAVYFAIAAHTTQKYGEYPYAIHLAEVAWLLSARGYGAQTQSVAWLHDVLEDTDKDISLIALMFGDAIAKSVDTLTRRDGESYNDYLERIAKSGDVDALAVKKADIECNLNKTDMDLLERPSDAALLKRKKKYTDARDYLNDV